jgi:hypothetical protein
MRYLLLLILCTGCSSAEFEQGVRGAFAGGNAVAQPQIQRNAAQESKGYKNIDYSCMDMCTQSYQYALCESKCSY